MNGHKRQCITISLYPDDLKILGIWETQTGMTTSEVIRFLIREFSDYRFRKEDYGWAFDMPAWRKEVGNG
jgi:hypothetical protein